MITPKILIYGSGSQCPPNKGISARTPSKTRADFTAQHPARRRPEGRSDVAKGIKGQKIGVAGYNQIFEEFVICRVAASRHPLSNHHRLCIRQQVRQPRKRGWSNQRGKPWPCQNIEKLPLGRDGFKEDTTLLDDMRRQGWQGLIF
jgi:hypothetical protein